jgi:hypothetical protein
VDSSSSTSPQPSGLPSKVTGPPIAQHPNPISLTSMPLRPKILVITIIPLLIADSGTTLGPGARSRSSSGHPGHHIRAVPEMTPASMGRPSTSQTANPG